MRNLIVYTVTIFSLALCSCVQSKDPAETAGATLKQTAEAIDGKTFQSGLKNDDGTLNTDTVRIDLVDAIRTSSIVTPYTGYVILHTDVTPPFISHGFLVHHPAVRVTFDWQDGRWIAKHMEKKESGVWKECGEGQYWDMIARIFEVHSD